MCITPEEVRKIVHEEVTDMLPVAIGKGIREAELHMRMSHDTFERFKNHEERILAIETLMANNEEFHKRVEPILISLEEAKIGKTWLNGKVAGLTTLSSSFLVIAGAILFIFEHIH